jgi:hypothetical protein
MPPFEQMDREQPAVLYAVNGNTDEGEITVSGGVQLDVRWEDKQLQIFDANGQPVAIDAVVTVDRAIPVNSILWQGQLDEIDELATDLVLTQVKTCKVIPSLDARETNYVVGVARFKGRLPTITGTS